MPRLFRVIIPVSDISEAATFYEAILGLTGKRVSPGRHYLDCEGTILALFDSMSDGDGTVTPPNPEYFYIGVDDLEGALARTEQAGATIDSAIEMQDWGERSFYFSDPFGNKGCFVDRPTMFTG